MMDLFAQLSTSSETNTLLSFLGQLGPASLAALATWFLTNRYEATVDKLTSAHKEAFQGLATALDKLALAQERRDTVHADLGVKLGGIANSLADLDDSLREVDRRLETLEKASLVIELATKRPRKEKKIPNIGPFGANLDKSGGGGEKEKP